MEVVFSVGLNPLHFVHWVPNLQCSVSIQSVFKLIICFFLLDNFDSNHSIAIERNPIIIFILSHFYWKIFAIFVWCAHSILMSSNWWRKKNRIIVTFSLFSSARWAGSVLCVILNVQRYKRRFDNSYHCMHTVIGCLTKSDVIVVVTILCDSKIKLHTVQEWFVCVVANVDDENHL